MIDKTCEYCGKPFKVGNTRINARFCSYSCRSKKLMGSGESARFWKGGKPKYKCLVCGKEGERRVSTGSTYKFCSTKCHDIYRQNRVTGTCFRCGKVFERKKSRAHRGKNEFCSFLCYTLYSVGEKSAQWRGGDKEYPTTFNRKFKNAIRERDNNTCAVCGKFGDNVHHINYVKMDTTPENCVTLCRSCHAKTNSNRDYWIKYFSSY